MDPESGRIVKKARIEVGVSSFVELFAHQESVSVDKTLLIENFWKNPAVSLLIAFPRRWGKSINMDMIREFFSLKLDANGNEDNVLHQKRRELFANLKIGQTDSMKEYGKYPVIHINMKSLKKKRYSEFLDTLKYVISDLYRNYLYLVNERSNLDEYQKLQVKKYVYGAQGLTSVDISLSLLILSKLLNQYHDQCVIILMDEYDAPYNCIYTEPGVLNEERDEIVSFLNGFNENTFKDNKSLEKSLMTGVLRLANDSSLFGLNNIVEHNFTSKVFSQYYGFSQVEVNMLCDKFDITSDVVKEKISTWYNGYSQGDSDKPVNVYCAWSIINYFISGEFDYYWAQSGSISFLNELFSNTQIKHNIEKLIKGGSIQFDFNDELSAENFMELRTMANDAGTKITSGGIDLFFSYLLLTGYLTQSKKRTYKLPNYELTLEFQKKLLPFYNQIYTINPYKMSKVIQSLDNVFECNDSSAIKNLLTGNFYNELRSVIEDCTLTQDLHSEGLFGNEDLVQSLLNFIALQVYNTSFATEVYKKKTISSEGTGSSGRADIMLSDEKCGLIIEMNYTKVSTKDKDLKDTNASNSEKALNQAKTYSEMIPVNGRAVYMQIFCGISISAERDVALSGEVIRSDGSNLKFNRPNIKS